MCLIVFAWQSHPDHRLILVGNRDELHARPAEPMHWWPDRPGLLAGRDLQAGGTWLALGEGQRFATVTNFRERFRTRPGKSSRGHLVADFVDGSESPLDYAASLAGDRYAGYCLLLADRDELCYTTNRGDPARRLEPGIYGLSNATLDTPWPKLTRSREGLRQLLERGDPSPAALMQLLSDATPAPAKDLDDELPIDLARAVSAPFIKNERYGTRCTTVVLAGNDGRTLVCERSFDAEGRQRGDRQFRIDDDQRSAAS